MSVCVCCTHLFSFFPLVFVLVNDLFFSLVSRCFCCFLFAVEMRMILLLLFVSFFLLHAFVFYVYRRVLVTKETVDSSRLVLGSDGSGVKEIPSVWFKW